MGPLPRPPPFFVFCVPPQFLEFNPISTRFKRQRKKPRGPFGNQTSNLPVFPKKFVGPPPPPPLKRQNCHIRPCVRAHPFFFFSPSNGAPNPKPSPPPHPPPPPSHPAVEKTGRGLFFCCGGPLYPPLFFFTFCLLFFPPPPLQGACETFSVFFGPENGKVSFFQSPPPPKKGSP